MITSIEILNQLLEMKQKHVQNLSHIMMNQIENITQLVVMGAHADMDTVDSRALLMTNQQTLLKLKAERNRYEEEIEEFMSNFADALLDEKKRK